MPCGNEAGDWDNKAVQDSALGKNTELDPKIMEHVRSVEIRTARNIMNNMLKNNVDDLKGILSNPNDPGHRIVQILLENSLGKNKVTKTEENLLPSALHTVLKDHPNPQGLFDAPPEYRGPGADPMSHPYELLYTAALIQKEVSTSLGKNLKIYSTDRIDFGQKAASNFALSTRKKGTIESDTLIHRGYDAPIGIDGKYSKDSSYGLKPDTVRQLEGISKAFGDGQLKEFYFVSNVKFKQGFKDKVEEYNFKILENKANDNKSLYNELEKLINDEKNKLPNKDVPKINLIKDNKELNKELKVLARKYEIPQIGLCEDVKYD